MNQSHTEREFKLRATAMLRPEAVDAVLAACGMRCRVADRSSHTDTYLDDAQQTLMRNGIGLRLRQGRDGGRLCHKTAGERHGALRVREELELPWAADEPPHRAVDLPDALRDRVEPYVLDRPLQPVVRLQVQREHRELVAGERELGELAIDAVLARTGAREAAFAEVELEVGDDAGAGERLVETLRESLPLEVAADDKLAHAARLLDCLPPPPAPADATLGGLLAARWRPLLAGLREAEARVRTDDDPEGAHQMRVCMRRLRALTRAFAGAWPADDAAFLAQSLQRTSRALGGLRERDVLIAGLPDMVQRLPTALRAAADELLERLARERELARASARAVLRAADHRTDLDRLERLGQREAMTPAVADQPASAAVTGCLAAAAARLRKRLRALDPDAPLAVVHRARIAGKRLRYLLEELRPARNPKERRVLRRIERVQVRLGEVCDHANAASACLRLLDAAGPLRSLSFHALLGGLAALHAEAARAATARAARARRRITRKTFWRRLERAGQE